MHASIQAAGHSVKGQEQARSAHALLCTALQLTSRYASEVAENVLGRLREMTIQEGSGQLAVFVETFRKHAAEHVALSDAATDFGPLLARAVARSEVTSPALCILQVKVGEMSEEGAPGHPSRDDEDGPQDDLVGGITGWTGPHSAARPVTSYRVCSRSKALF